MQQGEITNTLLVTTGEVFVHDITFTFADGTVAYYTLSDFFLDWRHCQSDDPWHDVPVNASTQDRVSVSKKRQRQGDDAGEGGDTEGPPRKVRRQETTPVRSCYAPLHCTVTHA